MQRDIHTHLDTALAVAPNSYSTGSDNTTGAVDLRGFDSAAIRVLVGEVSAAGVKIVVEERDDSDADWETVAEDHLQGMDNERTIQTEDADSMISAGYVGYKRYIQVRLDAGTGDVNAGAVVERSHAHFLT